jgi:hypothetical protein
MARKEKMRIPGSLSRGPVRGANSSVYPPNPDGWHRLSRGRQPEAVALLSLRLERE